MAEQVEVTGPLLTQHTSPTVIKKTFSRLGKLLDILKADMGKPLPPKTKFEKLDADGFKLLSAKLMNTVTKYVIFVCQEGTMKTIESQTALLLEDLRKMCTSLRAILPTASKSLKEILVKIGSTILTELKELTQDISDQITTQYKQRYHPDAGTSADPNALDNNDQITRITARIWGTCERLATAPITNTAAVAAKVKEQYEMIQDAYRELTEVTESEKEFPDEEAERVNKVEDNDDGLTEEERMLMQLESELTGMDTKLTTLSSKKKASEPVNDFDDDDLDFNEKELAKSEFKWIAHALALTRIVSAVLRKASDIMPHMTSPYDATTDGEINLAANATEKGLVDVKSEEANFLETLEARRVDAEYIAEHVDKFINALYTPQDLPAAARSAYFVASRTSKIVLWLDRYDQKGWLNDYHKIAETVRVTDRTAVIGTEKSADTTPESSSSSSSSSAEADVPAHKPWYESRLINATLPVEKGFQVAIEGEAEEEEEEISPEAKRRRGEFTPAAPIDSVSTWPLINEMRMNLAQAFYSENSLIDLHLTYRTGDELVDDSEDDDEYYGAYADEDEDEDEYGYDEYDDDGMIFY